MNADLQGTSDFVGSFADAGEDHPGRVAAGGQDPLQLAERDDIETGAEPGQQVQHRQVGVGLDRVADQVRMIAQRLVEGVPVALQCGTGVDIAGRAVLFRNGGNRHLFGVEFAITVIKIIHNQSG